MTEKQKIVLFLAFCCAVTAALLAKQQIVDIALRAKSLAETRTVVKEVQVNTTTTVVVTKELAYGTTLRRNHLKEVAWPQDTLPDGSFRTIDEVFKGNLKRSILRRTAKNEPLRAQDITGPNQRASLSSLLEDGKVAVTVPVNSVKGVSGFVLPGDNVDVLLTLTEQQADEGSRFSKKATYSSTLLHSVRVLGIGTTTDDRLTEPKRVKTVTLEVTPYNAERIALARKVGSLSLSLRKYGEARVPLRTERIAVSDLDNRRVKQFTEDAKISPVSSDGVDRPVKSPETASGLANVRIIRAGRKAVEYNVPSTN